MLLYDASLYLNKEKKLGKMITFPEISKDETRECNTSIRVDSIQSFMVERKFFNTDTGEISEKKLLGSGCGYKEVYLVFCLTKERKYCVSSFYGTNQEANLLQAVYTEAVSNGCEINWEQLGDSIKLFAALEGETL